MLSNIFWDVNIFLMLQSSLNSKGMNKPIAPQRSLIILHDPFSVHSAISISHPSNLPPKCAVPHSEFVWVFKTFTASLRFILLKCRGGRAAPFTGSLTLKHSDHLISQSPCNMLGEEQGKEEVRKVWISSPLLREASARISFCEGVFAWVCLQPDAAWARWSHGTVEMRSFLCSGWEYVSLSRGWSVPSGWSPSQRLSGISSAVPSILSTFDSMVLSSSRVLHVPGEFDFLWLT